jgi:D-lactate dehydrogenase
MRIMAFEVRDDEREAFEREASHAGVDELVLRTDGLGDAGYDLLDGMDAVLVLGRRTFDEKRLARIAAHGVRILVTRTIGMDHIDLDAARELGISCSNVTYSPDSVADFTLMLMLVALRRYKPAVYRQNVNDYSLDGLMGRTLSSMTVGIVGTGRIGSAVVRRLDGFGARILACGHHRDESVAAIATYVGLDELFRESDLISFHVPATPENHHMVNAESLSRMRDGVVLVNTARADLMDVSALISGIETGKIGALATDVFDDEAGIYHSSRVNDIIANRDMAYLRQFPNTVLTQHMAFYTRQSVDEMVTHSVEKALELYAARS